MKLFNYIRKKLFEPRKNVLDSNTLSTAELRQKLGKKYETMTDQELLKKISEEPPQELFDMFFPKKNDNK